MIFLSFFFESNFFFAKKFGICIGFFFWKIGTNKENDFYLFFFEMFLLEHFHVKNSIITKVHTM